MKDLVGRIRVLNESAVEECGMIPPMSAPISPPKQQDNVDMNVTLHAAGGGGIRDLLHILRDLEQQPAHQEPAYRDADSLMGGDQGVDVVIDDAYENEPEPVVQGIDAVTNIGSNDGRGDHERRKVNGGGNPYNETLVRRLADLYTEIKGS